jgi:type II secretory pathway component PulC
MGFTIEPDKDNQPTVGSLSSEYGGTQVKVGDIITHINDTELKQSTYLTLFESIQKMKIGDEYHLDIIRNGKAFKITENLYAKYDKNVFELDSKASKESIKLREIVMPKHE